MGKLTSLPGPARGGLSFVETFAAAGLGAAAANVGEYALVTRPLVAQVEQQGQQLTALLTLVHQQHQHQSQLSQQVGQLSQALAVALQALGVDAARVEGLLPALLAEPVPSVPAATPLAAMPLSEVDDAAARRFEEELLAAIGAVPEPR